MYKTVRGECLRVREIYAAEYAERVFSLADCTIVGRQLHAGEYVFPFGRVTRGLSIL